MTDGREVLNRHLLDEIAHDFQDDHDVTLGTMFRSPGLRVEGKVFAFLGSNGELIVKLPKARAAELVDEGTAEAVVMGKRTMREWIVLPAEGDSASTLALWRDLAYEAYRFVGALSK
ncbi:TfoX/Sxy family protein [Hoyosella altamirensis]|uniref:TfoX/Sxy family transcriptional regulator of competence genes n=1 Tax=Hoyosella altamirensis TaxID=616997 RepID=A0A839RLM4_9ACTN|nr:TfoX/Sxy family protein [Hoyosella altamirensis]MBB3036996.1 TfoX/Sxy family transcriptional regulator of competence genes [Hoyosella altamirensis]